MKLSIVIPVYRSEEILPELVKELKTHTKFSRSSEIILVNDSSPDNSWNVIEKLAEETPGLTGVDLAKNVGQHNAIMAGLKRADGDIIIIMDDDLQHSPQYIESLYEKILNGADVCYTVFENRKHKAWKRLGSKFNGLVANFLVDKPSGLYLSPFKAISRMVKEKIVEYEGPYPYIDGLILRTTSNIDTIKVEHNARLKGEGNYNLYKSLSLWTKMATGFSVLPLRLATFFGFMISIVSFLTGFFFIIQKVVWGGTPEGWASTIVIIMLLGGVQLVMIGILGEYIGRIYLNINKRPQYTVRKIKKGKK